MRKRPFRLRFSHALCASFTPDPAADLRSGLRCFHPLDHLAKLFERDVLNLPDAFASDTEFLADLLEGLLRTAIETEPGAQDDRFARIQRLDHFLQHPSYRFLLELLVGCIGAFVL